MKSENIAKNSLVVIILLIFGFLKGQTNLFQIKDTPIKSNIKADYPSFLPIFNVEPYWKQYFDDTVFPPDGWDLVSTNDKATWTNANQPEQPFNLIYEQNSSSALCPWSHNKQNEWIIGPEIHIPAQNIFNRLYFFAGFSKYWINNSTDFKLFAIHLNDTIQLWSANKYKNDSPAWSWKLIELKIDTFAGDTFQLAWNYAGQEGDLVALDHIELYSSETNIETEISGFTLPTQTGNAKIDTLRKQVSIELGHGTDFSKLFPQIILKDSMADTEPLLTGPLSITDSLFQFRVIAQNSSYWSDWEVIIQEAPVNKGTKIEDIEIFSTDSIKLNTKEVEVDNVNSKIIVELYQGVNLSEVLAVFHMSDSAHISPAIYGIHAFDYDTFEFVVTAQDISVAPQKWHVIFTESPTDYKTDITSFSLPTQTSTAQISGDASLFSKEISPSSLLFPSTQTDFINNIQIDPSKIPPTHTIYIEYDLFSGYNDLSKPDIEVAEGAEYELVNIDTIPSANYIDTIIYIYKVIPVNPVSEPATWTIIAAARDYLAQIESFVVEGQTYPSIFDSIAHTIVLELPFHSKFEQVVPQIQISEGATIVPSFGDTLAFTPGEKEEFVVTAADGKTKQSWSVTILERPEAIFEENFESPSFDSLKWEVVSTDTDFTWQITNETLFDFSQINEYSSSSAFCPWLTSDTIQKNESLISEPIHVQGYSSVYIEFYAGYNYLWHDSAQLTFSIIQNSIEKDLWVSDEKTPLLNDSLFFTEWSWRFVRLDLTEKIDVNAPFSLKWNYSGYNGDLAGIDDIFVGGKKEKKEEKEEGDFEPEKTTDKNLFLVHQQQCKSIQVQALDDIHVSIISLYGKILFQTNISQRGIKTFPLQSGAFVVYACSKTNTHSKKIVVQ